MARVSTHRRRGGIGLPERYNQTRARCRLRTMCWSRRTRGGADGTQSGNEVLSTGTGSRYVIEAQERAPLRTRSARNTQVQKPKTCALQCACHAEARSVIILFEKCAEMKKFCISYGQSVAASLPVQGDAPRYGPFAGRGISTHFSKQIIQSTANSFMRLSVLLRTMDSAGTGVASWRVASNDPLAYPRGS